MEEVHGTQLDLALSIQSDKPKVYARLMTSVEQVFKIWPPKLVVLQRCLTRAVTRLERKNLNPFRPGSF